MPKNKEKVVSFYDPIRNVYCDMPVSRAQKLINESKKLEKALAKEKKDEQ